MARRAVLAVLIAAGLGAAAARPAQAEVFANSTPLTFSQIPNENTRWSMYPTTIEVTGEPRVITQAVVGLLGYRRNDMDDDDMLLVGPNGRRVMLLSDAGSQGSSGAAVNVIIDDRAPTLAPDESFFGTGEVRYRVSDHGAIDEPMLTPAPSFPAAAASLGAAFAGTNPNGTWRLYMASDSTFSLAPRTGALDGGWQLELETVPVASPEPPPPSPPAPVSTPLPVATPAPSPRPPVPDTVAPTLSALRLATRFTATGRGAGATLTYRLSEAAAVRFTIARRTGGRRKGSRCVAPRAAPRGRRCIRTVALSRASFTRDGTAGLNTLRFSGRLNGRALPAGAYRLQAVPRDAAGNTGAPRTRTFAIARRR